MSKNEITIIKGNSGKVKVDKAAIYWKAYKNAVYKLSEFGVDGLLPQNRDYLKRVIYYGVKYINICDRNEHRAKKREIIPEECQNRFGTIDTIRLFMSVLTPTELLNMYPLPKKYDGEKWQEKDYFSAMEVIRPLDMQKPMGEKVLENVLWASMNDDLFDFQMARFDIVNDLRRVRGQKGMMEIFMEDLGVSSYTINETEGYMIDNLTGECMGIEKTGKFSVVEKGDKS